MTASEGQNDDTALEETAASTQDSVRLKLSEASELSGISVPLLKQLVGDDLLPHVTRGRNGHAYFDRNSVPTWAHCVALIEQQRDRHLRRALNLIERLERELEAVRNDINEAREYPSQPLGVDLLALGDWRHSHALEGETTSAAILHQFVFERIAIENYDRALREARESMGYK